MKNYLVVLSLVLSSSLANAQSGEFELHENGLIYSESTMNQLSAIVDSLNLMYKTCESNKAFYSIKQGRGHIITLNGGKSTQAKWDIANKISFEDFIVKYPEVEVKKDLLLIRDEREGYNGKRSLRYKEISFTGRGEWLRFDEDVKYYDSLASVSSWVYDKSMGNLRAVFFTEKFKSQPLSEKYARMIGYSDCLIDTTTTKFNKDAEYGSVGLPENWRDLSYIDKVLLLEKLRSTLVMGGCSMDRSPREHAINIAIVSAEAANWEVFLKSHLDIMNDRFDRMSDGSYAQAERQTYLRELEALNINVKDLILGICFQIDNAAENHYNGNIMRVGRALSESSYKEEIESTILSLIEDQELDDYNRAIGYFLFQNYNYHEKDEAIKKVNTERLKASVSALPEYIKAKITFE
jgi:hypothetical protein